MAVVKVGGGPSQGPHPKGVDLRKDHTSEKVGLLKDHTPKKEPTQS